MPVPTVNVTDSEKINGLLEQIVYEYASALGTSLASIYLFGSYADGTAIPESDVDCFVIFSDSPVPDHVMEDAKAIRRRIAHDSSVDLDIGLLDRSGNGTSFRAGTGQT